MCVVFHAKGPLSYETNMFSLACKLLTTVIAVKQANLVLRVNWPCHSCKINISNLARKPTTVKICKTSTFRFACKWLLSCKNKHVYSWMKITDRCHSYKTSRFSLSRSMFILKWKLLIIVIAIKLAGLVLREACLFLNENDWSLS